MVRCVDSHLACKLTMHISSIMSCVRVDLVMQNKEEVEAIMSVVTRALRLKWPDTCGHGAFWQKNLLYGAIRVSFDGHYASPRRSALAVCISRALQDVGYTMQPHLPPTVAERMRCADAHVVARRWGLHDCAHAMRSG